MAQSSGVQVTAAVRRQAEASAAYSTAASFGTNQIPLLSESMKYTPVFDKEEAVVGSAAVQDSQIVGFDAAGTIACELWTESLEYLLLAAMGFECPTVYTGAYPSGSGGSPAFDVATPNDDGYVHLFELDDDLSIKAWESGERAVSSGISTDPTYWTASDRKVRSFDLAIKKNAPASYPHAYRGCMVNKMTIKITPDQCAAEFDLLGRDYNAAAALNYTNWALPTSRPRILFPHCRLYMRELNAANASELYFQEMEISLENNLASARQSGSGAYYILEPLRENTRKVTVSMKLARYDSIAWEAYRDAGTDLQMQLKMDTGYAITGSTLTQRMDVVIPRMKCLTAGFPVGGPGVITGDVTFEAERPDTTYAWLTTLLGGITQKKNNEMLIFLSNSLPACYSRDRQYSGVTRP